MITYTSNKIPHEFLLIFSTIFLGTDFKNVLHFYTSPTIFVWQKYCISSKIRAVIKLCTGDTHCLVPSRLYLNKRQWNIIVWISERKQMDDSFVKQNYLFLLWFDHSWCSAESNIFLCFNNIWNVAIKLIGWFGLVS